MTGEEPAVVAFPTPTSPTDELKVYFMYVGQGDSILIGLGNKAELCSANGIKLVYSLYTDNITKKLVEDRIEAIKTK